MQLEQINKVAMIGAGTMGAGIGLCFALAGYDVALYDVSREPLEQAKHRIESSLSAFLEEDLLGSGQAEAAQKRIITTTSMVRAMDKTQFALEAVPEGMDLKRMVFKNLEDLCTPDTILATNTSGLSITRIQDSCSRPDRVCGMHWVNPPELVPLVEVIKGGHTSDATARLVYDLAGKVGKKPVMLNREVPGFGVNRLQFAIVREALNLVEQGVMSPEDVDRTMRYGPGFRWSWQGPLETADLGGLDVFHKIASYLFEDLSDAKKPPAFFSKIVEGGRLGIKTGRGFFDYDNMDRDEILNKRDRYFIKQWKTIQGLKDS